MKMKIHRKKVIESEKGFTLIEMLLVLFISFFLVSIVTLFSYKYIGEYNDTQIIYELQTKIREAQFLGYANEYGHYLTYFDSRVFGIYQSRLEGWQFAQKMPSTIKLHIGYANGSIKPYRLKSNMNVGGIGTLKVQTARGIEHYTINLGKGRFTHVSTTPEQ